LRRSELLLRTSTRASSPRPLRPVLTVSSMKKWET